MMHNINERGYGFIPKLVMQDRRLSIFAKAIYAYYCSYSSGGATLFPTQNRVMADLGVDERTYREHFNLLIKYKYITIKQEKMPDQTTRNIFIIEKDISF